jgi:predicted chitinase
MPIEHRTKGTLGTPGPFLAEITNHLDPTYMGSLEVALIKGMPNLVSNQGDTYVVKYLNPFYGVTSIRYEGTNSSDFNDVQKSYGMWMVPPDVGTTVMVIFIDGDPNQGYWMGCVQDAYQNHMVPGIAASKQTMLTAEQRKKYGTDYLPVAEFNKTSQTLSDSNVDKIGKPVHPFADRLLAQGLLLDTVRGVTSSSARREVPSSVFGISTPGPIDPNGKKGKVGYEGNKQSPISRLGGSTFVMDDGDAAGQNELVRIRTRTGHQILMHNSQDLIYIANSKGTAWIEMTSSGKLDIYAQDSVSIHTESDFNFRADRDINMEAGRNINMNAFSGIEMNCTDRFYLICKKDGRLEFGNNISLLTGNDLKFQSGNTTNLSSGTALRLNSGAALSIGATGNIMTSGAQIHFNGPAAEVALSPEVPPQLGLFSLPNRRDSAGWASGQFYKASNINSIMQRVPTHEPWDHHENINPSQFNAASTDVQVSVPATTPSSPTAVSGDVPINLAPVAVPASKSASSNELYLQSVLVANGVTDPIKLAAWMSQCKVESDGFKTLKEYASGAEYEGRRDLGNTQPGDGVRYKGRGFIQCTGRDVYKQMTKYFNAGINFEQNPELVETLEWAAKSVLYFFNSYKKGFKNKYMNYTATDPKFEWNDPVQVTWLVNGGQNALIQRQSAYAEYLAKFQKEGVTPPGIVSTGSGGILSDSSGNPVKSGI